MLKFFRNLRANLLAQDKYRKYLIYAIGEILLVVIGILIALQINNWNEQRIQANLEQDYLIALKKEFENNLEEVNRVINLSDGIIKNAKELAEFTGVPNPNLSDKQFAELFFGIVNNEVQYRPGLGVINEIINSGKLNIFQNEELKNSLATMDALLLKIRYQEVDELEKMRQELIAIGKKNLSLRKMAFDAFGGLFDVDQGRFLDSNINILSSVEVDNGVVGIIFTAGYLQQRYGELKEQLLKLIKIVDGQITKN